MKVRAALMLATIGAYPSISLADEGRLPHLFPGMTVSELQAVMGPPKNVRSRGTRDAFLYCPRTIFGINITRGDYAAVWLLDDRVANVRFYRSDVMGDCQAFFAAFRWEDEAVTFGYGAGPLK